MNAANGSAVHLKKHGDLWHERKRNRTGGLLFVLSVNRVMKDFPGQNA